MRGNVHVRFGERAEETGGWKHPHRASARLNTYLWTAEGWLYVAVVLDLYSRRAVGWSMQASMTAQLVTDALMMALVRRRCCTILTAAANTVASSSSACWSILASPAA